MSIKSHRWRPENLINLNFFFPMSISDVFDYYAVKSETKLLFLRNFHEINR